MRPKFAFTTDAYLIKVWDLKQFKRLY